MSNICLVVDHALHQQPQIQPLPRAAGCLIALDIEATEIISFISSQSGAKQAQRLPA